MLKFSTEHLWIRLDTNGEATVGVSEHAQEQLGDVVYIEPPEVGRELTQGEEVGLIESVKTNSELHAPASGTVLDNNPRLADEPELVNESPLDDGWIFRMELDAEAELETLLDEQQYQEYVESEG